MTKRSLNLKNLLNLSNLISMASRDKKNVIRKRGRKLIKYLEVMKWVILSNLQKRKRLPIGRKKTVKRTIPFFRNFEKMGKRISRMNETIVSG